MLPLTLYRATDFQDDEIVGRAEVVLDLAAVTLPEAHDFKHYLDLWQHPTGLARGLGVPLWSEEHWAAIELYGRELARLGQKSITIIASDSPWAGQRCRANPEYPSTLHEYNMVHIARRPDGTLRFDFSRLDRYVETYQRIGIDREIEVIGLLAAWDDEFGRPLVDHPDNIRLACIEDATGRITWLRTQAELRAYMQAWRAHLVERGWWEMTRFTADEPSNVELFRQRVRVPARDHARRPAKIALRPRRVHGRIRPCRHRLDAPTCMASRRTPRLACACRTIVQARGDCFLWYVSCGPARPNNFITSPSIEGRLQGWFTRLARTSTAFCAGPLPAGRAIPGGRPGFRFPSWPSGDMFFVYPGRDGRPVRTLRSETLLAGHPGFRAHRPGSRAGRERPGRAAGAQRRVCPRHPCAADRFCRHQPQAPRRALFAGSGGLRGGPSAAH